MIRALLKTHVLALLAFFVVLVFLVITDHTIGITHLLAENFQGIGQLLATLSTSLIVFPFVSFPAVERVISSAEEVGINVSPELVKDYASGCLTVFIISLLEVTSVILYSITHQQLFLYIVFSLFPSQLIVVLIIVVFLLRATSLLWRARGSLSQ